MTNANPDYMKYLLLTIRYLLFCLFFAAGAAALTLALLIDPEVVNYYKSRAQLEQTLKDNQKISSVTEQYKSQIALIESEPNVLRRLEQITFGQPPVEKDTSYPGVYDPALMKTAEEILKKTQKPSGKAELPKWVQRCSIPKYRRALMLAGAGLIMVAFIFFNTPRRKTVSIKQKSDKKTLPEPQNRTDSDGHTYYGP